MANTLSFNPCCSGSCPPGWKLELLYCALVEVSILVVVDHAPRDGTSWGTGLPP